MDDYTPSDEYDPRPVRIRMLVAAVAVVGGTALVVLLLFALSPTRRPDRGGKPDGPLGPDGATPSGKAEQVIHRSLRDTVRQMKDGTKLEVVAWGPHMGQSEWLSLLKESGMSDVYPELLERPADGVYRVRYRLTRPAEQKTEQNYYPAEALNQSADEVYLVSGNEVRQMPFSPQGDYWKTRFRLVMKGEMNKFFAEVGVPRK